MTQKVDCEQFQQRIDKILDSRKSLEHDAILKNHSFDCADCKLLLSDYQQIESVLTSHKNTDLWNDGFDTEPSNVVFRKDPGANLNRIALMVGTLAAVLLVSISLSISNLQNRSDNQNPALTVQTSPITPTLVAPTSEQSEDSSLVDHFRIRRAYVEDSIQVLGSKISEGQMTLTRYSMQPAAISASIDQLSEKLQPLNAYYRYSVELPGIRPVQASLSATFDLIQKSLEAKRQHSQQPDLGLVMPPAIQRV